MAGTSPGGTEAATFLSQPATGSSRKPTGASRQIDPEARKAIPKLHLPHAPHLSLAAQLANWKYMSDEQ
jgi:hypothetical protein